MDGRRCSPLLILEQQVDQLRAVEGLDELLVSELSRVSEDVRQLIDDIADQDGNENERKSMATSRKSSRRGATTAYTGYEGPAIDMVAVRSAQKRVAMMMCVAASWRRNTFNSWVKCRML